MEEQPSSNVRGHDQRAHGYRGRWLPVFGMALGIAAAAYTLIAGDGAAALPENAVAKVNERVITREGYQRAVAAVESERRTPLTVEDKRRILERLIDEELLVQHGLIMGLMEQDRRLRGQLVAEVMAAASAMTEEPDDEALRRYYAEHRDYFSTPGRLRVAAVRVNGPKERSQSEAIARAEEIVRRLRAGEPAADVAGALGDELVPPLPNSLLPPAKLRAYLGPTLTESVMAMNEGQASDPLESGGGYTVLHVLEKEAALTPPFEEIAGSVREARKRRADEKAVRELLHDLRKNGAVLVRDGAP